MSDSLSPTGLIICSLGVRAEIALKIFGEDLDTLRTTARACAMLAAVPGIVDLQVEKQVRIPQLEIRVDYTRAALYGVQPAAVLDQLSRLSNGRAVSASWTATAGLTSRCGCPITCARPSDSATC